MAKGAATARKAARKVEKRDGRVRESLDAGVTEILEDWTLAICDRCGLEQGNSPHDRDHWVGSTCLCGSIYGTYAPADRANQALRSLRSFT